MTATESPEIFSLSADSATVSETASSYTATPQPAMKTNPNVDYSKQNKIRPKGNRDPMSIFNMFGVFDDMDLSSPQRNTPGAIRQGKRGREWSPVIAF